MSGFDLNAYCKYISEFLETDNSKAIIQYRAITDEAEKREKFIGIARLARLRNNYKTEKSIIVPANISVESIGEWYDKQQTKEDVIEMPKSSEDSFSIELDVDDVEIKPVIKNESLPVIQVETAKIEEIPEKELPKRGGKAIKTTKSAKDKDAETAEMAETVDLILGHLDYFNDAEFIAILTSIHDNAVDYSDYPGNLSVKRFLISKFDTVDEITVKDITFDKLGVIIISYIISYKDDETKRFERIKYKFNTTEVYKNEFENTLVKCFKRYIEKWRDEIDVEKLINSDVIYNIDDMVIDDKYKFLINEEYNIGYNYKETHEYINNKFLYSSIFCAIAPLTTWNKTINKKICWETFKQRKYVVYNTEVDKAIETLWDKAKANIDSSTLDNPMIESWKLILNSVHMKNIICHCYPSIKPVDKFLKSVLTHPKTLELTKDLLKPIRFLFTPYSVYVPIDYKVNKGVKLNNSPSLSVKLIECIRNNPEKMCEYNDCYWAYLSLHEINENDKRCGSVLLFDKFIK